MILSLDCNKSSFTTQQLQGRKHLNTLSDRHIGIDCTMQEEQRCVNLIGIVQWTLIDKKLLVAPRLAVGHRNFTIRIAPITFTPVAGVVANARM